MYYFILHFNQSFQKLAFWLLFLNHLGYLLLWFIKFPFLQGYIIMYIYISYLLYINIV